MDVDLINNINSLIIRDAIIACQLIREDIDEINRIFRERGPQFRGIIVDLNIPVLIRQLVSNIGIVYSCLFKDNDTKDSGRTKICREQRRNYIDRTINGLNIIEFRNKNIRNKMDHLDFWIAKKLKSNQAAVIDLAISHSDLFNFEIDHIFYRVFVYDIQQIWHLDIELNVQKLRQETDFIIQRFGPFAT